MHGRSQTQLQLASAMDVIVEVLRIACQEHGPTLGLMGCGQLLLFVALPHALLTVDSPILELIRCAAA